MIKNIISNLLDKFNKRNLGEVTISLIVAILVFLALAFGIIELGTMAYKDMVVNNRLESVVKTAESKSDLFVDESASVLITYKNKFITCDENYELNCCSEDSCCSTRHCEICSLGDGICHEEKALCRFWKTLYEVAKQEDLGGVYDEFTPRFNYSSDKGDKGDEGDRKCMAKVAVLLPGFYINYNNGSTVTVHVPASEGKEARNAKVRVYDFKVDRATESVLSELKHDGVISAEVDVIKEKGLFSFYLGDNDKGFTRKMYHSGKPRIYANDKVTKVPCPTERVCGVLCCAPGLKGIKCDSSGDEECCTPNSICGNICCTGTEQCLNAESSLCCPLDRICDTQCCEEGQECVEGKNGNKTCGFVTPTNTNTLIPPTNTNTPIIVVTEIATETPVPPTNTNTQVPPTDTNTPVPPTNTNTPVPPTDTNTPIPPTNTPTLLTCSIDKQCDTTCCQFNETCVNKVCVIVTPTPTDTPIPPTDTPVPPTDTPLPPTDTPIPPTNTLVPPTNTPFGGGCRCPSGYVCEDDPEGDDKPNGENNRCCDRHVDGKTIPGEGCCKEEEFYQNPNGDGVNYCCNKDKDGDNPGYVWSEGQASGTFSCQKGCPPNTNPQPLDNSITDSNGRVYDVTMCCPGDTVVKGRSQFLNAPVCCNESDTFCGGGCCTVGSNCAEIKGSVIAIQGVPDGLDIKEAKTCCPVKYKTEITEGGIKIIKDSQGIPQEIHQVRCGDECCDEDKCISPNDIDKYTKLNYADLTDRSVINTWQAVGGLLAKQDLMQAYRCCHGEIFTNLDGVSDCCQTVDENGEEIATILDSVQDDGTQICCAKDSMYEEGGIEKCCLGTLGTFTVYESESSESQSSSQSFQFSFDASQISQSYSDSSKGREKIVQKCCETGRPYLDENNNVRCCEDWSFNTITNKCCESDVPYFITTRNYTIKEAGLEEGVTEEEAGLVTGSCCESSSMILCGAQGICCEPKNCNGEGIAAKCMTCESGEELYVMSNGEPNCCGKQSKIYVKNKEGDLDCCENVNSTADNSEEVQYQVIDTDELTDSHKKVQICCEKAKVYTDENGKVKCCDKELVQGKCPKPCINEQGQSGYIIAHTNESFAQRALSLIGLGNDDICCVTEICNGMCCPEGQTCQANSQCGESEESQCCPYGYIAGEGADCSYENGCKLSDGENYCCLAQFLFKPHLDVGDPENVPCRMESDKPYKTCSCKPQYHGTSFDGEEQCCPVLSKKNIGRADIWSGYVCIREGNRMATTCKIGEKIGQTAFFAEYLYDHRNDAMPHPKCCVEYDSGYYGDLCCGEAFCESGN